MTTLRLRPELEEALRRIPGVRAASVVTMLDATPTEVHILADRAKQPKQLVRDIQSLALASYDIDLDHRIVSVVQLDDEDVTVAPNGEITIRWLGRDGERHHPHWSRRLCGHSVRRGLGRDAGAARGAGHPRRAG